MIDPGFARVAPGDEPVLADIEGVRIGLTRVAAVRRQVPALANRRPEAYRLG